jgi:hypothetical protein
MNDIDETAMLLSGQLVRNEDGTFYFDKPGNWVDENGWHASEHLHRIGGPAIIYAVGNQFWYLNGKLHREDGPAAIWTSGSQFWYFNGKQHRTDGPAVTHTDGRPSMWYIHGVLVECPEPWNVFLARQQAINTTEL